MSNYSNIKSTHIKPEDAARWGFSVMASIDNPKASKATQYGYLNAILYMAPKDSAGVGDLCVFSGACADICLGAHKRGTKMARPNLMFIEDGYARMVTFDREGGFRSNEFETCRLHPDRYVRIDDGKQYRQLCRGGQTMGNTLIYRDDATLARQCNARLYKTRAGYERAKAKLQTIDQWVGAA